MYYRFAGNAGVGSLLKAMKNKGEGDGRVTFSGCLWCRHYTQELHIIIDAFGGPKAPQWGGLI